MLGRRAPDHELCVVVCLDAGVTMNRLYAEEVVRC